MIKQFEPMQFIKNTKTSPSQKWFPRIQLGLFLLVLAIPVYFLMVGHGPDSDKVTQLLASIKDDSLGLPMVITVFVVMGLVGVPQFVLIAASVFAFGPVLGSSYAWVGTMISACLHFWLGRWVGAGPVQRFGGKRVGQVVEFVSQNGFWSSLLVRVVPSGPFVLVNLALGVSRAQFMQFGIGTAFGILPKILAIAFVGQGLLFYSRQQSISLIALFFGFAALTFVLILVLRRAWKVRRNQLD